MANHRVTGAPDGGLGSPHPAEVDDLAREDLDDCLRYVLKELGRSVLDIESLGKNLAKSLLVDVAQLDEAGSKVAPVDQLGVQASCRWLSPMIAV